MIETSVFFVLLILAALAVLAGNRIAFSQDVPMEDWEAEEGWEAEL